MITTTSYCANNVQGQLLTYKLTNNKTDCTTNNKTNNDTHSNSIRRSLFCIAIVSLSFLSLFFTTSPVHSADAYTLQQWLSPFSTNSSKRAIDFGWETSSYQGKKVCAIIPPSATSYWFAVNYGLVKKARQLDINLKVFHVLDRFNFNEHEKLIDHCLAQNPQSIIVSAALGQQISQKLQQLKSPPAVVLVGKNIVSDGIMASSATSYRDIGASLAKYMNKTHAVDKIKETIMFPGDQSEQFVKSFIAGFKPVINPNKYQINHTIYTSNNYVQIKNRLADHLNNNLNTSVIVGSALVAQAAVEVLEEMSLTDDVQIISYELSAQVYRDIRRGNILTSVSNLPVIQGLLAIDLALKLDPKSDLARQNITHISPMANIVDSDNVQKFDISYAFAPYGYRETLEVN